MTSIELVEIIVIVFTTSISSSGLWAWFTSRSNKKSAASRMLLGLGHDRIVTLALIYIKRGNISSEEYNDLAKYLFAPYKDLGGNSTAQRLMDEVNKLPIIEPTNNYRVAEPTGCEGQMYIKI